MVFLSAGWLWLLVPWAALAVWCWRRRPEPRGVTARFLWADQSAKPATFALRRRPPLWVICLLAAMLLGIASLAGAAHRRRASRVLMLIDPAAALGAVVDGRTLRDEMIDRAARSLPVDAVVDRRTIGKNTFEKAGFTARVTDALVGAAIDAPMADFDAVVLLTDKPIRDPRVVVIAPATRPANAGIERVAIRAGQLMARLDNFAPARAASLRVTSGESVIERTLQLAPGRQDVFIDLPAIADRVDVELVVADDPLPIDNVATLLKAAGWPRLVVAGRLPEAASRFADVYAARRPSDATSVEVLLADRVFDANTPAIVIAGGALRTPMATRRNAVTREGPERAKHVDRVTPSAMDSRPPSRRGPSSASLLWMTDLRSAHATDHPLLSGVDLNGWTADAASPAGEWAVVADVGGLPIVAVREAPARQVWIGAALDPTAVGSVVLLNNAVTWVAGNAAPDWSAVAPDAVGVDWSRVDALSDAIETTHGLYRDGAGRTVAVNVPAVAPGEASGGAGTTHIASRPIAISLARAMAMSAAGLVLWAAWSMRGRGPS